MIVATIARAGNLHRAVLLAKSLKDHMPDIRVAACVVETGLDDWIWGHLGDLDHVVLAGQIGLPNLERALFPYSAARCANGLRAAFLQYLLRSFPEQFLFLYADPDLFAYGPFDELVRLLEDSAIVLTPYYLEPAPIESCLREIGCMKDGTFHSGLLGIRRTEEAERFVRWWADTTAAHVHDPLGSMTVDQKWLDFVPSFFEGVRYLKCPSYDVGVWNLHETKRQVRKSPDGSIYAGDRPLRCFSFPEEGRLPETLLRALIPESGNAVQAMLAEYRVWCAWLEGMTRNGWSYDCFQSGEPIEESSRAAFREHADKIGREVNPFALSNAYFAAWAGGTGT
jgi:hypothetical protein